MSDFLEKYIHHHRGAFKKVESFDESRVWRAIQSRPARHPNPLRLYAAAAAISLLVALTVSLFFWNNPSNSDQPLFTTLEDEYQVLIDQRLNSLEKDDLNSSLTQELLLDIQELDLHKEELLQDASIIGDQNKILHLLRKYYEQKLRTLELIEKEIQLQKHENEIINL